MKATWSESSVGRMVELENGFPFDSTTFAPEGDVPLVRIRDLRASEFETYVPGPVPERVILQEGDVVIGMDGDFDVVRWARGPAALNQRLCRLRPRAGVDLRFVEYALPLPLQIINDTQYATTVKHLSSSEVLKTKILAPSGDVQRQVADFLDGECARIDEVVRLRQEQVSSLMERRLMLARAVTTQGDETELQSTGVYWMPTAARSWSLPKISTVFRTGSGTTPSSDNADFYDGDTPWVNTGDIKDRPITRTAKRVTGKALAEHTTLRVYAPGALIVAMYGQGTTKGRVAILEIPACVNQACCVLTPRAGVSAEWAFHWFQAHKQDIVQLAVGAGQPNLNQDIIRALRIPIPPQSDQMRLTEMLNENHKTVDAVVTEMSEQVELLKQRKRSMIKAAVTGEFDISTASGRGV